MYPDFVVPISCLLDKDRRLVAIYRGSVDLPQLIQDVSLAQASSSTLRDTAVPFAGRWFTKPASEAEIAELVGKQMFPRNPEESIRHFRHAFAMAAPNSKRKVAQPLLQAHVQLARVYSESNDVGALQRHFREAIKLAPTSAAIHHEFGTTLAKHEQYTLAEPLLREALRLRPESQTAKRSLQLLLQKMAETPSTK